MRSALDVRRSGHVTTVTINRPRSRNALTASMLAELEALSRSLADDTHTRVLVLRAAGRDFSVGADLKQLPSIGRSDAPILTRRRSARMGARLMRSMQEIEQPTICAVQGIAVGGGACLVSACDFRIAADDARIGYGEVRMGLNLMWHALPICVRLIGPARAKRMIMTGEQFDARTLHQWGFIDEVVPRDTLDAAAEELAVRLSALPPVAVQMIKRSINELTGPLDRAIMHADGDQALLASMTDDHREAIAAFFHKRKPNFQGK